VKFEARLREVAEGGLSDRPRPVICTWGRLYAVAFRPARVIRAGPVAYGVETLGFSRITAA